MITAPYFFLQFQNFIKKIWSTKMFQNFSEKYRHWKYLIKLIENVILTAITNFFKFWLNCKFFLTNFTFIFIASRRTLNVTKIMHLTNQQRNPKTILNRFQVQFFIKIWCFNLIWTWNCSDNSITIWWNYKVTIFIKTPSITR